MDNYVLARTWRAAHQVHNEWLRDNPSRRSDQTLLSVTNGHVADTEMVKNLAIAIMARTELLEFPLLPDMLHVRLEDVSLEEARQVVKARSAEKRQQEEEAKRREEERLVEEARRVAEQNSSKSVKKEKSRGARRNIWRKKPRESKRHDWRRRQSAKRKRKKPSERRGEHWRK